MSNRASRMIRLTLSVCILATVPAAAEAKTIYVDDDAAGVKDGTSWADAYTFLQDALADASLAEKPVEVRVAHGSYKPDRGAKQTAGSREATFQLINGVSLKGGFAGVAAPDPNVRDIRLCETVLSGDLVGDDISWSDLLGILARRDYSLEEPNRDDNVYHVVIGSATNETAVLDGFTIAGGCAAAFLGGGGGMYNDAGNPTVADCTFTRNSARGSGGGMSCENGSNPTLTNCIFSRNWALVCGGMDNETSNPSLTNCTFTENFAHVHAGVIVERGYRPYGGMVNWRSNPTLTNCSFINNLDVGMGNSQSNPTLINCTFEGNMGYNGGGMYNYSGSSPTLTYCVFRRNSANGGYGGGICGGSPALTNCIFAGNEAGVGGGIGGADATLVNCTFTGNRAVGAGAISGGRTTLLNCIVWGNSSPQITSSASISFSIVPVSFPGEANINTDPLFAEPGHWANANDPNVVVEPNDPNAIWIEGDYHLKSQAGRWDPASQSWIKDDVTSPCIDAGDPNSPVGDEPKPNGGRINMGAYGGTKEASKSLSVLAWPAGIEPSDRLPRGRTGRGAGGRPQRLTVND